MLLTMSISTNDVKEGARPEYEKTKVAEAEQEELIESLEPSKDPNSQQAALTESVSLVNPKLWQLVPWSLKTVVRANSDFRSFAQVKA